MKKMRSIYESLRNKDSSDITLCNRVKCHHGLFGSSFCDSQWFHEKRNQQRCKIMKLSELILMNFGCLNFLSLHARGCYRVWVKNGLTSTLFLVL